MKTPLVSVILVNYNGRPFLGPCLEALRGQSFADFETVLVDNGSSDGSAEWVARHHPEVRLLAQERNLGFAAGNNVGIAAARGEFVVLLNNDTRAEAGFLQALVEAAQSDPTIGMVAGVLVFAHRPERINSAGLRVQWDGVVLDERCGELRESLPQGPVEVFGPSGGAALYRRSMLAEVGPFRPEFFAYLEDADLAWRGRLAGWRCLLAPQAVVQHVYSATSSGDPSFKSFHLARNRLLLLYLDLPAGLWWRYGPFILGYDLAACAYGLLKRDDAVVRGRLAALGLWRQLRPQRQATQRLRRVPLRELSCWLVPPLSPWGTLRLRREIAALSRP